jgi:hypothetical protein
MWEFLLAIGGSVAGLLSLVVLFFGIRKGGADAQKAKDQEHELDQSVIVIERISDAQDAGNRVSTDLHTDSSRLREDDGHRRKD